MIRDRRGVSTGGVLMVVVTLAVAALLIGTLFPVALNEMNGDTTDVVTQSNQSTVDINGDLNATLTDTTAGTPDTATYRLETSDQSITNTIDNGSEATYSFNEGDVVVNVSDVDTAGDAATASFTYSTDFSFGTGASAMWALLGLAVILAGLLFLFGLVSDDM